MQRYVTLTLGTIIATVTLGSVGCSNDHAGGPLPGAPAPNASDFRGKTPGDPTATLALPTSVTADQVFSTRCATCHGREGRGDGPAAKALNPRPRNYADPAWQKSVTDAQIKKAIIEGGSAVGKSSLMAPNADLADKPVVIDELVKIVRSFGQKNG